MSHLVGLIYGPLSENFVVVSTQSIRYILKFSERLYKFLIDIYKFLISDWKYFFECQYRLDIVYL